MRLPPCRDAEELPKRIPHVSKVSEPLKIIKLPSSLPLWLVLVLPCANSLGLTPMVTASVRCQLLNHELALASCCRTRGDFHMPKGRVRRYSYGRLTIRGHGHGA